MQSTEYIIQLARERALFSFCALIRPVIQDAEKSIAGAAPSNRSADAQKALWLAGNFLTQDSELFRKRFEAVFCDYLERAMRTMYRDLRMRLGEISANELSLIDDETVNRELKVDRLLLRLREANDESLTRINIIVAQLHGHKEVKERENPFRPYLIARALHQVLLEVVPTEAVVEVLFEHLSNALANHLSAYYEAIRTVFESRGIRAKLLAQPGRLVKHQRYAGGSFLDGEDQLRENSRVELGFQNIMNALPHGDSGEGKPLTQKSTGTEASAQELQEFVRRIFARSQEMDLGPDLNVAQESLSGGPPGAANMSESILKPASAQLLSLVDQFQQKAANKQDPELQVNPKQFELFELNHQIDGNQTGRMERVTIDVVGILFQYLLEDEQIPKGVRDQIGRLQIPFLKAAMMAPEVLQQPDHPARKLLNRMSSVAVGMDLDTPAGKRLTGEMMRIVEKILDEFDGDTAVFTQCLAELETAVAEQSVSRNDKAGGVAWIEEAVHSSEQLTATVISLRRFLQPLIIDERAFKFFCEIWAKVLCQETFGADSGKSTRFRDLLPNLLWSIQEKRDAEERSALLRLLPSIVNQLKEGMLTICLSEAESQKALDQFVTLHMEVLRSNKSAPARRFFALEELQRYFSTLIVGQECSPPPLPEGFGMLDDRLMESGLGISSELEAPRSQAAMIDALEIRANALESALAEHGIANDLESGGRAIYAFESDTDWMAQMQLGICVERWTDDSFQIAHLAWISRDRTLFLFRDRQTDHPFVYSAASLLRGLREGSVRMVEYAPAFDRAVDALLLDAGALQTHGGKSPQARQT